MKTSFPEVTDHEIVQDYYATVGEFLAGARLGWTGPYLTERFKLLLILEKEMKARDIPIKDLGTVGYALSFVSDDILRRKLEQLRA